MDTMRDDIVVEKVDLVEEKDKVETEKKASEFKKYSLVAFVYAIIYTFCLFENHRGITYPIYMIATLVNLKIMRGKDGLTLLSDRNGKKGLGIFYVVSLVLLGIHRCLTVSSDLFFLEGLACFLLLFSFIVYLYCDTTSFDVLAWLLSICITVLKPLQHIGAPISDFSCFIKSRQGEMDDTAKSNRRAVLLGIIIAIPLLMIIISLLYSADIVFANMFANIGDYIFIPDNIGEIIRIIFMTAIAFWFAYTLPRFLSKGELKLKANQRDKENPVVAITFTSLIGLVYIVFCGIQVVFLFTRSMKLPDVYTYADYAHEGFYQLLTVCLINIAMVSICQRMFKESIVLRTILTVIAACTYIMIASSAMRMILYVSVYHLTFLRLFVLWFLVVLCIWLAFLIASLYVKSFPVFRASMVAITVAFIGFVYCNPEYQIAKYDMEFAKNNEEEYEEISSYILYSLSFDAIDALTTDENLLKRFADHGFNNYSPEEYTGFRKFNFSYNNAKMVMKK